jgi:ABC-type branched-subunit amino acid transport system ATPase component
MLKVNKLSKSFGGVKALDSCSFAVEEGSITGLIGPNGSGKTTLFNIVSGVYEADKGSIVYDGEDITRLEIYKRAAIGIGRTFQIVRIFPRLRVIDNVLLAQPHIGESFWRSLIKNKAALADEAKHRERALELLEVVGLAEKAGGLAKNLSYGQQKLLEIARALAVEPKFLLLDEPLAGVNPALAQKIIGILRRLRSEGKTILVIEHRMRDLLKLADKMVAMDNGRVIAQGTPLKVLKDKKVIEAYLGEKHRERY